MTEADSSSSAERVTVATPEAARALLDPVNQGVLAELLEEPQGARVLADRLGLAMNTLHYRLRKLEALGLIAVHEVRPRAGRGIRVYSPTARVWDIPFELTPAATIGEFVRMDVQAWLDHTLSGAMAGIRGRFGSSFGKLNAQRAHLDYTLSERDQLGFEGAVFFSQPLRLSPARAKRLRRELEALIDTFTAADEAGDRTYSLNLLFYPEAGPSGQARPQPA